MSHVNIGRRDLLFSSVSAAGLWGQSEGQSSKKARSMLVVAADMADAEWGASGLIFKALKDGFRVVIVVMVGDWSTWPQAKGKDAKGKEEILRIAKEMGVEKIFLDYKYHRVPVDLEIKRRVAEIHADVQPDIALIQSADDHWTDHANTARAAKDGIMFAHGYLARPVNRPRMLLTYPVAPNQTYDFRPNTFVDTTDVIDRIAWVVNEIGDVLNDRPSYVATTTLEGPPEQGYPKKLSLTSHGEEVLAGERRWGGMCGVRYAEAFGLIQQVPQKLW
jgi:LmbE family N-acetylglucosaminyl deacetylase